MLKFPSRNFNKSLSIFLRRNISYKNPDGGITYSQMVRKLTSIKIPEFYKRDVFSSLFEHEAQTPKSDLEQNKNEGEKGEIFSKTIKSADFTLIKNDYASFLQEEPFGGLQSFEYKGKQLTIAGLNFANLPDENVWKLMQVVGPDAVFMHLPPDDFVIDFTLAVRNPKTGKLSNRNYFSQLEFGPQKPFVFDVSLEKQIARKIDQRFYVAFEPTDFPEKERLLTASFGSQDKLTNASAATAALFCRKKKLPLILSDLPDIVLKDKLVSSLTVSELKELLKAGTLKSATNPDFVPRTPLFAAHSVFPELISFASDSYAASLLEYAVARRPFTNALMLCGFSQARAIRELLNKRSARTIADNFEAAPIVDSLLKRPSIEELAEKLAILDVLKYGQEILRFKIEDFESSTALLEKYSGLRSTEAKFKFYYYLHQQMVKKYLEEYFGWHEEGIQKLENYFSRKVMARRGRESGESANN